MQTMHFKTVIHAPKETVWKTLWDDATYRQWTAAFCDASYVLTDDWKQGTEVKFLDPAGSGLVSKITDNRPNEFMSFTHLGELKNGVEDRTSEKVKSWIGAKESYTLMEKGGVTELAVDTDMADEYVEMFQKMWSKAMENIKTLSEQTTK